MSQEEPGKAFNQINQNENSSELPAARSTGEEIAEYSPETANSAPIDYPPVESVGSYGRLEETSPDESSESSSKSIQES